MASLVPFVDPAAIQAIVAASNGPDIEKMMRTLAERTDGGAGYVHLATNWHSQPIHLPGTDICATCFDLKSHHIEAHRRATPVYHETIAPSASTLCFDRSLVHPKNNFWTTLGRLYHTATRGKCQFCCYLTAAVYMFEERRYAHKHMFTSDELVNCWVYQTLECLKIYVWWSHQESELVEVFHMFPTLVAGSLSPFGMGLALDQDFQSQSFWDKIQSGLDRIPTGGVNNPSPNFAPTRLLHIADMESDSPNLTLVVPRADSAPQYVALSHRWPKDPPPRLLRHMVESGGPIEFPWSDLTETFRDAVRATRFLGLQHLWIDSLCIIQDDADDWETEAALMGSVYEGAYVTVAGNGSLEDGHDSAAAPAGFLQRNIPTLGGWIDIEKKTAHKLFARLVSSTPPILVTDSLGLGSPNGPLLHGWMVNRRGGHSPTLFRRGWCFQERMASRRILHFAENECFLECMFGFTCECMGMNQLQNSLKEEFAFPLFVASPEEPEFLDKFWRSMITQYSMTSFTFEEDVYSALIHLAHDFHERTGMTYIAGLWRETIIKGLAWMTLNHEDSTATAPRRRRPRNATGESGYVAPTFSWMSSADSVAWVGLEASAVPCATLKDCGATPKNPNSPFGLITYAFVTLRGVLAEVRRGDFLFLQWKGWKAREVHCGGLSLDTIHDGPGRIFMDTASLPPSTETLYLFRLIYFEATTASTAAGARSLPGTAASSDDSDHSDGKVRCAVALILRKEDKGEGDTAMTFTRVGIAYRAKAEYFDQLDDIEITII